MTRYGLIAGACLIVLTPLAACDAPEDEGLAEEQLDVGAQEVAAGPLELAPIDHSGVTGTVRANADDDQVTLTMTLQGLQPEVDYTAHVHSGRCAAGGPVVVPFEQLEVGEDGQGTGRLRTSTLPADETLFVQVHGSGGQAVACGDLNADALDPTLLLDEDTAGIGGG